MAKFTKIKRTTYNEFKSNFLGLNRLKYEITNMELTYGPAMMPSKYLMQLVYNKKKDCTYVAITRLGFLAFCEPTDDLTIVARYDGKLDEDSFDDEDMSKELKMFCEECYTDWNSKRKA